MKKKEEYLDPDIREDLEAISQDERYENIEMPPELAFDIFGKIAEYEQAETEGNIEKIMEIRSSVGMDEEYEEYDVEEEIEEAVEESEEQLQEAVYAKLSPEDQEALRLGQELLRMQKEQIEREQLEEKQEPKKVRRFGKKKKVLLLVAVMAAMMAGAGIVSVGDDMRWLVTEEKAFEENVGVSVDSDVETRLDSGEIDDENAAYELADEVIGVPVVRLSTEEGLAFDCIEKEANTDMVYFYYCYEKEYLKYSMVANKNKMSYFEVNEGNIKEEYEIVNGDVNIYVQVYEDKNRESYYINYTYNNVYYFIKTTVEEEKLHNILGNLNFY